MIVTLTARELKSGAYEQFRQAWDPGTDAPEALKRWKKIYHCRDLANPDVVISFGFFDGSPEQLREAQQEMGRKSQLDRVGPITEDVLIDGSYEVVEELTP